MCQVLWKGNLPAFLNSDRTVISTFKNFRICKVIPDLCFHSFFIKHIVDHPRLKKVFRLIFLGVVIRVCRVGAEEQNGLIRHHVGHSLQVMPWPLSKVFTDLPPRQQHRAPIALSSGRHWAFFIRRPLFAHPISVLSCSVRVGTGITLGQPR